ncbi:hypothetical protein [Helicobacter sp. T3_23-1056]
MMKSGVLDCHEFAMFVQVADSHNDAHPLESIFHNKFKAKSKTDSKQIF